MVFISKEKEATPNPNELLNKLVKNDIGWVKENTAILVVHGIGNQLPLETLDQFGRGLIKQYRQVFEDDLELKHEINSKPDEHDKTWFENVLRISKKGSEFSIDIFEYYWANYTEDKASWNDMTKWLHGVVKGANSFYEKNGAFGKAYKDNSIFFDSLTGDFIAWRYRFFLTSVSQVLFIFDQTVKFLIWIFSHIPFVGRIAANIIESYTNSITQNLVNLLVDVVAYNVVDPKSKFYAIRSQVLDGAVKSLQYLLEKTNIIGDRTCNEDFNDLKIKYKNHYYYTKLKTIELTYPSVIIAGHSLGTQIAYDAINRINLMINKNKIATYDNKGRCRIGKQDSVCKQIKGFITFGSPLDKVVFFLRENIPNEYYLRQQFLDDYHGFKQRPINSLFNNSRTNKYFVKADCGLHKFFEDVPWRNYYDDKDYVSGGLDYYTGVTNVNCKFRATKYAFTHSYYWESDRFYIDIINNFL